MDHKRIILVGPTCAGKNYIREKFRKAGYICDVSYTTREPREGEEYGVDYYFLTETQFLDKLSGKRGQSLFYEHVKYGDYWYGTGKWEWDNCEIFIMETDGVNKITEEDRKNCLVIYINTPLVPRTLRMRERGWDEQKIKERVQIDLIKFQNFNNYDLQISSESQ